MGRLGVEQLVVAIDDPAHAAPPTTIRLPMVLRERESTGKAPGSPPSPRADGTARTRRRPPVRA